MYFKLLSGLIVAFWLVTTGLLIQMVYFPEESHFSEVQPSQVIDLFLSTNEHADMDLFSGKELVGSIKVLPLRMGKGEDAMVNLKMAGGIDVEIGHIQGKVKLLSELWLRRAGALESFSIKLEMRELGVSCQLSQTAEDEVIQYLVKSGDTVLLDSSSASTSIEQQFQAQLLMRAWGIDLSKIQQQVKAESGASGDRVKMSARRGMITVEGTRLKGYILEVKALGDGEIKFFFNEAGELMKMDSFLDYRLVNYQLRTNPDAETMRDNGKAGVVLPVPDGTVLPQPGQPGQPGPTKETP